jgi:signal peptidase I
VFDPAPPVDPLASSAPLVAPRRAWVAGLLTWLAPGLGQLYAGAPVRAVAVQCAATLAFAATFWLAVSLPAPTSVLALYLGIVGVLLVPIIDAVRVAQRAPPTYVLRWYNRWYIYLALALVSGLLVRLPMMHSLRRNVFEAFWIPTGSMQPTILAGDHVFVTPLRGAVSRGDIVVYRSVGNTYVKRAVALAEDTIAMRHDTLLVNGRAVLEPYAMPTGDAGPEHYQDFDWQSRLLTRPPDSTGYRPTHSTWGPLLVPSRNYFILGDNRGASMDSRYTGPVPADSVQRRPVAIFFSRDPISGEIRWRRIGRDVSR